MQLSIPTVGVDVGPTFAYQINTSLSLIDSHNHTPGSGAPVPSSGLNINASLPFNNQPATALKYLSFQSQTSATTTIQAISSAPTSGINELWYTDSNGNATQITSNGVVNATIGSLPGESYAAGTFTWVQGTGSTTPANFDIGGIIIRPTTANTTNGVQLIPSGSIASQYALTLPLVPASKKIMSTTSGGVIAADVDVDNSTLAFSGTVLSVKSGGITSSYIASNANITGSQLSSSANIASTQLAACSLANHTNSSSYSTGLSTYTSIVTVTCSPAASRPFAIQFEGPSLVMTGDNARTISVRLYNTTDSVAYYTWTMSVPSSGTLTLPISAFNAVVGVNGAVTASSVIALQAKIDVNDGITSVNVAANSKAYYVGW